MLEFWIENRPTGEIIGLLVEEYLLDRELKMKLKAKKLIRKADTTELQVRATRTQLGLFAASFGDKRANELSTKACERWLFGLLKAFAPKTVNHYRTEVAMFFNDLIRNGLTSFNPMAAVKLIDIPGIERPFYSVVEATQFFEVKSSMTMRTSPLPPLR